MDLGDLKTGIGFGGRRKALPIVKTDVFVNDTYSIDTDNSRVYAGTSLTF
ncbi:MAG: hypothetical protein ACI8ZV_002152 [Chitinophagales bacterium]|jgi:hypothetical protein